MRFSVLRIAFTAALAAALLPGAAAAAGIPMGKARAVAAKRLFAYVYPLSYVTGYELTGCTRAGAQIECAYRVTFYTGGECTGAITVEPGRRAPVALLKAVPCAAPIAPPAATTPPALGGGTGGGTGSGTTTPTPPPTTTPPVSGGVYTGTGDSHWIATLAADGSTVILEDGSKWQIAAAGIAEAKTWFSQDSIFVGGSSSSYTLTNLDAGTGPVAATYLGASS
jgi:hypothetical protein